MSDAPSASTDAAPRALREDARTIALVGLAHGSSHFFHMLLPPMFPWLMQAFGLSYAQMGVLVSVFFMVSGLGQALAGFLVDKVGARPVLFAAFGCFIASSLAAAAAQGYGGLMLAAALAGLGNAPFHPVDFTILNKRVSPARLGHGFSAHAISGNLGWAVAPLVLAGITAATGQWRAAYGATAVLAALVLAVLVWQREAIDDRRGAWAHEAGGAAARPAAGHASVGATPAGPAVGSVPRVVRPAVEHPLAFLKLPSVWLCFSFFFWTTVALSSIQSFAAPALRDMHGLPLTLTATVVTGYMLFGVAGMLAGGFLVARAAQLERVIAACLLASAAALALVASGWVGGLPALALTMAAGLGTGLAAPSRDMLIKRAAPPGATGRVYGTVYSGLDLGFALAAPLLGWLMDAGRPEGVFWMAAAALGLGVASAAAVGRGVRLALPRALPVSSVG